MKTKIRVEVLSEDTKVGLLDRMDIVIQRNQQLIAENEEFRQKLAEPRTITEKIKSWWGRS